VPASPRSEQEADDPVAVDRGKRRLRIGGLGVRMLVAEPLEGLGLVVGVALERGRVQPVQLARVALDVDRAHPDCAGHLRPRRGYGAVERQPHSLEHTRASVAGALQ
jgi:hypothetical protein